MSNWNELRTTDIVTQNEKEKSSTEVDGLTVFKVSQDEVESETQLGLYKAPLPQEKMSTDLKEFLERPVKVYTYTWDVTGLRFNFDPYDLFVTQQNIARKISNYQFLS